MSATSNIYLDKHFPESLSANHLSIAVIGPDDKLRTSLVSSLNECHQGEIRDFSSYPPSLDDLPHLLEQGHDIIMIEVDSKPEYALDVMEGLCAGGVSTIMVYSRKADPELTDPDLLMQCMRMGAREFLSAPFASSAVAEALVRAAARRPPVRVVQKGKGELLVFCGAKGGAGVTSLACNFAMALAKVTSKDTVLIDLDLPLGDTALHLGISPEYSTMDALENYARLDSNFLSKLLVKHVSGLKVLAAPGRISAKPATNEAIARLLTVASEAFDYVVVDAGSKLDSGGPHVHLRDASTIYLVTQSGIPELRNANRLISQYVSTDSPKLEIVLNRCESRGSRISDEDVMKALTRPAKWKIPNDYNAFRKMQDTAAPVISSDSYLSWQIDQMARTACGLPEVPQKKKNFMLLGLGRGNAPRGNSPVEQANSQRLSLITGQKKADDASETFTESELAASDETDATDGIVTVGAEGAEKSLARGICVFNGRTYEWGADGIWQLKEGIAGEAGADTPGVEWCSLEAVTYGTPLGKTQLAATASLPGRFDYTPSEGLLLPAGTHSLWLTFTPDDAAQPAVQSSAVLSVTKATPVINWPRPDAISYGTALTELQFNASASIPGSFEYVPDIGEMPSVGTQTLLAVFSPSDTENYLPAQAEVPLAVTKSATRISWPEPESITYGMPLGDQQLNAIASVPGSYAYSPSLGSVIPAGSHTLRVEFTPEDCANHTASSAEVAIQVSKAAPIISWSSPESIVYGVPLSSKELNATSSVPGSSIYIPAEGAVLGAGKHNPILVFTPADGENYSSVQMSVPLTVAQAEPVITWEPPAEMAYGSELGETELNAMSSVPGLFVFDPPAGSVLTEGQHSLSATFAPIDGTNYTEAKASATLRVTEAPPVNLTWSSPAPIAYGTPLSNNQLNCSASVPGTFSYTPVHGEVLPAGDHSLAVVFTPTDSNLPQAMFSVALTIIKAKPATEWPALRSIQFGTTLSSAQLNAKASVPGRFTYQPPEGELPPAGELKLSATFVATDSSNFDLMQIENSLTVTRALPELVWSKPTSIAYGTALDETQLNAEASMQGSFVYAPGKGTVLAAGAHTLSVRFVSADARNFAAVQASTSLVVREIGRSEDSCEGGGEMKIEVDPAALDEKRRIEEQAISYSPELSMDGGQAVSEIDQASSIDLKAPETSPDKDNHLDKAAETQPEIRTYRGATYRRGPDGQWHLIAN